MAHAHRSFTTYLGVLLLAGSSLLTSGQQDAAPSKYVTAQVLPITVQSGISISDKYLAGMQARIAHALESSKRFEQVLQSENVATPEKSTLRIAGTVTKFIPGNRAERYFIGYGAGATKITVHVVFTDAETGKTLLEQDVRGEIWFGSPLNGYGNPNRAQKDISKSIKKIAEKNF
ncbi:MAG: DUF4410 domain-containing protein [Acidobacteriaceae bacterium]